MFRIENFCPILLDNTNSDNFGKFCIGDCYIILHTYVDGKELVHNLYQWIGSQSENDKLFCSAIYAVYLKRYINFKGKTIREVNIKKKFFYIN